MRLLLQDNKFQMVQKRITMEKKVKMLQFSLGKDGDSMTKKRLHFLKMKKKRKTFEEAKIGQRLKYKGAAT